MRRLAVFLLLFWLVSPALASPEVESYFQSTDPVMAQISELRSRFVVAVAPLRKSRDLLGVGKLALEFNQSWSELKGQVAGLTPPLEVSDYQVALARLIEVQLESNTLVRSTVDQGLALTAEIKAMRASGATDDAVEARIARFSSDGEEVTKRLNALRLEAQGLGNTLREQRARLDGQSGS